MSEIGWFMLGFFIFITLIFVAIAFFLPEWVGITGKKAHEIIKEHTQEQQETKPASQTPPKH